MQFDHQHIGSLKHQIRERVFPARRVNAAGCARALADRSRRHIVTNQFGSIQVKHGAIINHMSQSGIHLYSNQIRRHNEFFPEVVRAVTYAHDPVLAGARYPGRIQARRRKSRSGLDPARRVLKIIHRFPVAALGLDCVEVSDRLLEHRVAATPMRGWGGEIADSNVRFVFSNEPVERLALLGERVHQALEAVSAGT